MGEVDRTNGRVLRAVVVVVDRQIDSMPREDARMFQKQGPWSNFRE